MISITFMLLNINQWNILGAYKLDFCCYICDFQQIVDLIPVYNYTKQKLLN